MKEETWSIRKMREARKYSDTRNTYKRSEASYIPDAEEEEKRESNGSLDRLFKGFLQFLEE